jgi:hypothetical protein
MQYKKILKARIWALAPVLMLLLAACSRESDNLDYDPQTFAYKVGSVWHTGGLSYCWYTANDTAKALKAELYGDPITVNYLHIEVTGANYLPPRQYNVGYDSLSGATVTMRFYTDGLHPFTSTNGNLTITEFDTVSRQLSGTFQFTGTWSGQTRQITNGSINSLKYIKQ